MKKLILITCLFVVFSSCDKKHDNNKVKVQTEAIKGSIPNYTIIKSENMSDNFSKRFRIKVQVNKVLSENELKLIGNELIPEFMNKKYKAVMVYFYKTGTDINGSYNAGMIEWGPYGSWSEANSVQSGDYSKHSMKVTISKEIKLEDKTGIPIAQRKKIFYEIVLEEDRLYNQGVKSNRSQKAAEKIAKKYNITIEQVKKIGSEGVLKDWPMP